MYFEYGNQACLSESQAGRYGKVQRSQSKRNAMKVKGITDKKEAKEKKLGEAPGEVFAAIAMAMHEMQSGSINQKRK